MMHAYHWFLICVFIHLCYLECNLELYGSSLTGFGFKSSDVNIDIQFPKTSSAPQILIKTFDVLSVTGKYVTLIIYCCCFCFIFFQVSNNRKSGQMH